MPSFIGAVSTWPFQFISADRASWWLADLALLSTVWLLILAFCRQFWSHPHERVSLGWIGALGLTLLPLWMIIPGAPRISPISAFGQNPSTAPDARVSPLPLRELAAKVPTEVEEEIETSSLESATMEEEDVALGENVAFASDAGASSIDDSEDEVLDSAAPPITSSRARQIGMQQVVETDRLARFVFLAWLGAALYFLVRMFVGVIATWRLNASATRAPDWLQREVHQLIGTRLVVEVKLSKKAPTAAVLGLLRPTILVNDRLAENKSDKPIRFALAHEVAHIQHGDLWLMAWTSLLATFYGWHPLFHMFRAALRADQETCADLAAAGPSRFEYADAMLAWARLAPPSRGVLGLQHTWLPLGLNEASLSRRVKMLVEHEPIPSKWTWARRTSLVALSLFGFCVTAPWSLRAPTWAGPQDESSTEKKGDPSAKDGDPATPTKTFDKAEKPPSENHVVDDELDSGLERRLTQLKKTMERIDDLMKKTEAIREDIRKRQSTGDTAKLADSIQTLLNECQNTLSPLLKDVEREVASLRRQGRLTGLKDIMERQRNDLFGGAVDKNRPQPAPEDRGPTESDFVAEQMEKMKNIMAKMKQSTKRRSTAKADEPTPKSEEKQASPEDREARKNALRRLGRIIATDRDGLGVQAMTLRTTLIGRQASLHEIESRIEDLEEALDVQTNVSAELEAVQKREQQDMLKRHQEEQTKLMEDAKKRQHEALRRRKDLDLRIAKVKMGQLERRLKEAGLRYEVVRDSLASISNAHRAGVTNDAEVRQAKLDMIKAESELEDIKSELELERYKFETLGEESLLERENASKP